MGKPVDPPYNPATIAQLAVPVPVTVWHAPTGSMPRKHQVRLEGVALAWAGSLVLVRVDRAKAGDPPMERWYASEDVERVELVEG